MVLLFFLKLLLRNRAVDFVEICNVCARKAIINTAKKIINTDKMYRTYSDLNFGITFFGTKCSNNIILSSFIQCELNILRCAHDSQTNKISISARMSTVTANVVVGQLADCSIVWLRRLQSSSCQLLLLPQ